MESLLSNLIAIPDFPKPGILFQDITPILGDPALLDEAAIALAAPWESEGITHVIGVEARGFIMGPVLARYLGAGFVPVRKQGKLPRVTHAVDYGLEYGHGKLEVHSDAVGASDCVLIHDDVLATGGTAAATASLMAGLGASIAGFSFLLEIAVLGGRSKLPAGANTQVVLTV